MGNVVSAEQKTIIRKRSENCMGKKLILWKRKKINIVEKECTSKKFFENTIQIYFKCVIDIFIYIIPIFKIQVW